MGRLLVPYTPGTFLDKWEAALGLLFILDFLLHGLDSVSRVDVKRDGLAREGLYENLHARHGVLWWV